MKAKASTKKAIPSKKPAVKTKTAGAKGVKKAPTVVKAAKPVIKTTPARKPSVTAAGESSSRTAKAAKPAAAGNEALHLILYRTVDGDIIFTEDKKGPRVMTPAAVVQRVRELLVK